MSHPSPVDTVRNFCAEFGPTYDDAVATCQRFLHPDVNWQSVIFNDHPVDGLDALLEDLRRALETFRASGFRMDVRHIQADGDVVSVRRTDELLDGEEIPWRLTTSCRPSISRTARSGARGTASSIRAGPQTRGPADGGVYSWTTAAVCRRAASWPGGAPNMRRYSRLNCEGLSYPTA